MRKDKGIQISEYIKRTFDSVRMFFLLLYSMLHIYIVEILKMYVTCLKMSGNKITVPERPAQFQLHL